MKLSSLALIGALGVSAPLLVGCSEEPAEAESEATSAVIQGVIRIERTLAEDGLASTISAKFMRAQPDDLSAADRLVGTQLEIPSEGECSPISEVRTTGLVRHSVELVDVGDLALRTSTEDRPWQLTPRAFPDIGDLVSGVFYTQPDVSDEPGAADLRFPVRYDVSATGTSFVDPFSFGVDVPAVPSNVRVGGGALGRESVPTVAVGRDIAVDWSAPSSESSTDGLVYVDVLGAKAWRCTFRDTGAAILPSDVLSREDAQQFVVLSIHRVREETVPVDFQGRAQKSQEFTSVRFDFARSGRVIVE